MTIQQLLKKFNQQLAPEEISQLLALALHKKIEYIFKNPEKKLNHSSILTFKKLLNKKLNNWSLAYLKGYKEFYNLKFLVSKHTLIPRPDSELIVEETLKFIKPKHHVLDIGTGSGCLLLSVAESTRRVGDPTGRFIGIDVSSQALKTAKTNARKLNLKNKVQFKQSNLFSKINNQKFNIIMANLPYLTPDQMKENSIQKEPSSALLSSQDGLEHYRKFLKQIPKFLAKKYLILLEINPEQKSAISKEIKNNLPKAKIELLKDLAQNIRVVKITNSNSK